MIWWIPLSGLVLAGLVLGLAVRPVLRRLPALKRALRRLAEQATEAQRLQASAQALRQRMETLANEAAKARTRPVGGSARAPRESVR